MNELAISCCKLYQSYVDNGTTHFKYFCDVDGEIYTGIDNCIGNCYRTVFNTPVYVSLEGLQFLLFLLGILIGVSLLTLLYKAIL